MMITKILIGSQNYEWILNVWYWNEFDFFLITNGLYVYEICKTHRGEFLGI